MLALQSLDPGHLIVTDEPLTLLSQFLSPVIQVIDGGTFLMKLLIPLGGQPVTDPVGFQIGLFLKDVRRGAAKSAQRYPVS